MITIDITKAVNALKRDFPLSTEAQRRQAVSRAINRTLAMGKTSADREIRRTFNMKKSDVMQKLTIGKSSQYKLVGHVNANTSTMTMARFVTNMPGFEGADKDVRVEVEIKKGKGTLLKRGAFVQKTKSGQTLVFFRGQYSGGKASYSDERTPITPMKTVSIAGAGVNDQVKQAMKSRIEEVFPRRIEHELANLMR